VEKLPHIERNTCEKALPRTFFTQEHLLLFLQRVLPIHIVDVFAAWKKIDLG
jgi:hypothetical protein